MIFNLTTRIYAVRICDERRKRQRLCKFDVWQTVTNYVEHNHSQIDILLSSKNIIPQVSFVCLSYLLIIIMTKRQKRDHTRKSLLIISEDDEYPSVFV